MVFFVALYWQLSLFIWSLTWKLALALKAIVQVTGAVSSGLQFIPAKLDVPVIVASL